MQARDIVLGLLMQGPMSGYDIKQQYESRMRHFFNASYGSVYPTLKLLEKEGLLEKKLVVQEGKPNKNMYSITESGLQQFLIYVNSPVQEDIVRSDLTARLYFGSAISQEQLIAQLKESIIYRKRVISQLSHVYQTRKDKIPKTQIVSIQFGLHIYRSQVEVLERSIEYIRSNERLLDYWD